MFDLSQQPDAELSQEQEQKCILVVDDEAIIRDLCSKALKGYRVLQACDGEEALQIFEKGGIDVILTDVMMPKIDGIELLKRLKEKEPTLVVIIMTGFAEKDVILNSLKADADDFIAKPLNLLQLKTSVDKALVKKALKEEIVNLKNLDRLKSNFLSIISHKFRTPITAISLFLQNLASGIYDAEDEAFKQNLRLIFNEACYLERLVADLLTFSRVMDTGGGLQKDMCSLNDIIRDIITTSKEAVNKPGVETCLGLEPVPPMQLDGEKIRFAIKQVIDNAYKFSKDFGKVSITMEKDDGKVKIVVEDNGVGISKEDIPKIFEKFFQVDSAQSGQIRGFGLGLYYAREFIRLHGGSIAVESEPGKGTSVTITLSVQES